jgi:uridine kinase
VIGGVGDLAGAIIDRRRMLALEQPMLVAISGIDASGKGTLAAELTAHLREHNLEVEPVGADTWLTPLEQLDLDRDPGGEFYRRAIRFDEMFRRIEALEAERPSLDVILAEGIFLFKPELRHRYDLSIWLDCGFETALERALARNQEGLPADRLIDDYRRIYFPAQETHLSRDFPIDFAGIIHPNETQNS